MNKKKTVLSSTRPSSAYPPGAAAFPATSGAFPQALPPSAYAVPSVPSANAFFPAATTTTTASSSSSSSGASAFPAATPSTYPAVAISPHDYPYPSTSTSSTDALAPSVIRNMMNPNVAHPYFKKPGGGGGGSKNIFAKGQQPTVLRAAAGQVWSDSTLTEWDPSKSC